MVSHQGQLTLTFKKGTMTIIRTLPKKEYRESSVLEGLPLWLQPTSDGKYS
jgi:hypothetical protein